MINARGDDILVHPDDTSVCSTAYGSSGDLDEPSGSHYGKHASGSGAFEEDSSSDEEHLLDVTSDDTPLLHHGQRQCYVGKRWVLTITACFVCMTQYALRFDLSVAVVAMAGNVTENGDDNGTIIGPEFSWTKKEQGYLNSAFFYGYMGMCLSAGWVVGRFGAQRSLLISTLLNALVAGLTPVVARFRLDVFIVLRVLQGLSQAVAIPSIHCLLGKWSPRKNLALMAGLAYSGLSIGVVLVFTAGSVLNANGFGRVSPFHYSGDNWPSSFYAFGVLAVVVAIAWQWLAYESPAVHPTISREERLLIESDLASDDSEELREYSFLDALPISAFFPAHIRQRLAVPWRDILLSRPAWVLTIAMTASDFGLYTLLTCVPTYFHEVLDMPVVTSGVSAALPYMGQSLTSVIPGLLVHSPRWRRNVSFLATRKLFTAISFCGAAGFLLGAAYSQNKTLAFAMVTMAASVTGLINGGCALNHIDLSPRYAGVLIAYTNFYGSVAGIIGPFLADALTPHKNASEWRVVFYITAGVYIGAAIIYCLFASADRQPWADGEQFQKKSASSRNGHRSLDSNRAGHGVT